jgi:hypothetical protein
MALTLSFGYKKNQTGDKGSVFFPDLEFNIQRINDHDHDGVNSKKIPLSSIDVPTHTVLAAGWAAIPGELGSFSQDVTVPANVNLTRNVPRFVKALTGEILSLSVIILTPTTYTVFINDNSVDLQVTYV